MLNTIRKRNQREREKQKKSNSSAINLVIQNNELLVIENNDQHLSITTPEKSSSTDVIPTSKPEQTIEHIRMLNTIRKRNQREREKQRKIEQLQQLSETSQQNHNTPTIEQQLSTNLMSPSSNISNFNLLHLTNSGHNNHILQPNSSSMEVSEIISSVDIDSDNFILDHNSSSSNVISGNYF